MMLKVGVTGSIGVIGGHLCREILLNDNRFELIAFNRDWFEDCINLDAFVDKCDVCSDDGVEVHHIHQQALADKNGYINDMHKNIKYNLMNVCEKCHDKIHRNEIFVNGYIQTSNGIELQIKRKEDSINLNVAELKSQGFSKHKIKSILEERGMSITMYKLNKMLQDANNTLQKEY